jgi:hypothetical protein
MEKICHFLPYNGKNFQMTDELDFNMEIIFSSSDSGLHVIINTRAILKMHIPKN